MDLVNTFIFKYTDNKFLYIIFNPHNLGAGSAFSSGAPGASHGSRGGATSQSPAEAYGDIFSIGQCGSGGGSSSSSANGGRGGGRLEIIVGEIFEHRGIITANAQNAPVSYY